MNIGEASKASGVSTKMIRYYESIGLISAPLRTGSGYRVYSDNEVHALRFISRARDLGFSAEQMGDLLALWRDRSRASADVKAIALEHIRVLDEKAQALQAMSETLRHLADNCHGDGRPDCPIIEGFAEAAPAPPTKRKPRFGVTDIPPDRTHA
ncbi:Cu(I)-responsive transcriptional regulator [Devosia rhizoryzae]|uniref:Cu(I)-responsive transcriptional regulator n=1 Tax=Devosia rhizoryzae TaxID=2774137 RepID=A0ABX7C7J2_9HYPH|nr:Cu(I)-responsive transcriptional regulator [Devosia rhizoryzae]QQR40086.1 Cu(I)-responsive transcriptional regulator [Devosia rhizoryzae]